jgi:peptidoglycan/LPS O-acetylase OafA/YrhL
VSSAAPADQPRPTYRPDIDGLRAVAVLAVLLFHAHVAGVSGGYVGVDVFFVISGYLITQQLMSMPSGPLPGVLGVFYLRRARRILPALLVVCIAALAGGWFLLMPLELINLGKNLAAATLLLSNLAAHSGGGYFGTGSAAPLQHLWSIAVEEQFYVCYPLLLLFLNRFLPARRRAALALLALASFVLCVWASHAFPGANYYASPTRAWELLAGAVLALSAMPALPRPVRELLAVAALGALALAIHYYGGASIAYPGIATLLPCAATLCLIASGSPSPALVNRLLAARPLVVIGLMSYSLYLWHRPLFVYAQLYHITPLSAPQLLGLLTACFVIAALCWRFLERPIHTRALLASDRRLLAAMVATGALVVLAGVVLWRSDGYPQRFDAQLRAALANDEALEGAACLARTQAQIAAGQICEFGERGPAAARVLLWGDSHALALLPGFRDLARERHLDLYFAATAACWPLLGVTSNVRGGSANSECTTFNAAVLAAIHVLHPATVILSARWSDSQLLAAATLARTPQEPLFSAALRQTLAGFDGAVACVVFDVPQLNYPATPTMLMARRRHIADGFIATTRAAADSDVVNMEAAARSLTGQGLLRYADPKAALCPAQNCLYQSGGQPLYFDEHHLSPAGARYVEAQLSTCLPGTPAQQVAPP